MAQQSIEYGYRQGSDKVIFSLPMAASVVLTKTGGAFVITDASGNGVLAGATNTGIVGHLRFVDTFTTSATAGATILPCDYSTESIYELPISAGTAWNDNKIGDAVELIIVGGIQQVNLGGTTDETILVVGKGTTNAAGTVVSALVKINPAKVVLR